MSPRPGAPEPEVWPVVVVGCGPVGMTLAGLLGAAGVRTLVLERQTGLAESPRAVGTDDDSLRVWQALDLAEKLLPDMTPSGPEGTGLVYRDPHGRPFLEVRPERRTYGFAMGYGFLQPLVEQRLLEKLHGLPPVTVRFGRAVDGLAQDADGVRLSGADPEGRPFAVRAAWVVACDGGRSELRRRLGVAMRGSRFAQRWLVLDTLEPETPERNLRDVDIWCDPERPAVSIPRRYGHRRFEFRVRPDEPDPELLEPARLRQLLALHTDPDATRVVRSVLHTFRGLIADRFRVGRVLLAGDAAHVTPPFAGQGLAIGIRDASNLAWKLALVAQGRADPSLLDSYEQERRPHAWATVRLALRLGRIMTPAGRLRARLVPAGIRLATRSRRLRDWLREGGPRPAMRLRAGFFVRAGRGRVAGHLAHQPRVRLASGEIAKLDHALGPGFALLGLGAHPQELLREETLAFWRGLGARLLEVVPAGCAAHGAGFVEDLDGGLAAWLGDRGPRLLLVRPDRIVAADCAPERAAAALGELARRLRPPP